MAKINNSNKKVDIKNFICSICCIVVPALYYSFFRTSTALREKCFMLNEKGKMTIFGVIVDIVIALLFLFAVFRKCYYEESRINLTRSNYDTLVKERSIYQNNYRFLNKVSDTIQNICHSKSDTLENVIRNHLNNTDDSVFPKIITNPVLQLEKIIEEFKEIVADITGIKEQRHLYAHAMYRMDSGEWQWLRHFDSSLDIKKLEKCPYSTMNRALDSSEVIIINNKFNAKINKSYFCVDENKFMSDIEKYNGSILAKHFYIGGIDEKWCELIIFIDSMYSDFFYEHSSKSKVARTLECKLTPYFEERTKIELSLFYIQQHS